MSSNRKTRLVYRYDDQHYHDGEVITSRGDSIVTLTIAEKTVEMAVRQELVNGEAIRGNAVYAWIDKEVALRLWRISKQSYLYALLVDEDDILFESDLNHYSDATEFKPDDPEFDAAISRYCLQEPTLSKHTSPRIEVLFEKGVIVKKLCSK